jgi:hypothetical protein
MLRLQQSVGNRAARVIQPRRLPDTPLPRLTREPAGASPGIMIQRDDGDLPPVGTFRPSAGITVDRVGQSFTVAGSLQVSGAEAREEMAEQIQNSINTTWNHRFRTGERIRCNIRVTYRDPNSRAGGGTQIVVERMLRASYVIGAPGNRTMHLNANEDDFLGFAPAHEFGHILGMEDRYIESLFSEISNRLGGPRRTTPEAGYEQNLMGVTGGRLESQNIRDLTRETAPGFFDDDDQVRAWIARHRPPQIASLPTDSKVQMIRTLLGGWISDADVNAMVRICESIIDPAESPAIRRALDITNFSNLMHRLRIRNALSSLP